jgi:hypothetical protein
VVGEFGLLELYRLNLFKFRIKFLKIKRKLNLSPSWVIDPYNSARPTEVHLLPLACHSWPLLDL